MQVSVFTFTAHHAGAADNFFKKTFERLISDSSQTFPPSSWLAQAREHAREQEEQQRIEKVAAKEARKVEAEENDNSGEGVGAGSNADAAAAERRRERLGGTGGGGSNASAAAAERRRAEFDGAADNGRRPAVFSPSPGAGGHTSSGNGQVDLACSGCGNEARIPRFTCKKKCGRGYCAEDCFEHRGDDPRRACQCIGGIAPLNQPQDEKKKDDGANKKSKSRSKK